MGDLETRLANVDNNQGNSSDSLTNNKVKELEELIEERTNRQMRQTIVIKGIREDKNEKTWNDTKRVVASKIMDVTGVSKDEAFSMLNRVHRSQPSSNPLKKNRRDIFAALYSWQDCEFLIKKFRRHNIQDSGVNSDRVFIDYKYGPLTTLRRGEALKLRKELKADNSIVSGFIAYPARLMVKRSAGRDVPYVLEKDFSSEDVSAKIQELRHKTSRRHDTESNENVNY